MKPSGQQFLVEFLGCSNNLLNNGLALKRILREGIAVSGLNAVRIDGYQFQPIGVTVFAIISESHVSIHTYPEARHASIDIFTCSPTGGKHEALLAYLKEKLGPKTIRYIETLRGNPIDIKKRSWFSEFDTNGYEIRYHIKRYLLSKRTPFQQIDIIDNDDFGLMLFLDRELQIAEKDAALYNQSLTAPIMKEFKQPEHIVILGGGDGGVLADLLLSKPRAVTLVDIDRDVIESAQKYLNPICKKAFNDPRVKIHIADAHTFLCKTKTSFDAMICDLTMHPEKGMDEKRERYWRRLLREAKMRLKSGGMITLQCGSELDSSTTKLFSQLLPSFFENTLFKKTFIPSFCERWVFASARAA